MRNFSCVPAHVDADCHSAFYDGFCKHYLWPALHYLLPPTPADLGDTRFDDDAYRAFISVNRRFAGQVIGVLSPDDGDLVIVHDYHLWALPTFLRRGCARAAVGFFLHSPFPATEFFRTVPVRDDLLRALLNADLLGFQTFDYAHQFASSCSRLLGASSGSRHGHISIDYHGRSVLVKVLPVGLDMLQLRAALASPEVAAKAREIADEFGGRKIMIGVDDVDQLKGVNQKLLALERLFEERPDLRQQVVLVQINNPPRTHGRDVDRVRSETEATLRRIDTRFGTGPGTAPAVRLINGPVPMREKAAYYAAADCCVVTAVRDGLNRVPYFYTASREEGPAAPRSSALVLSEFAVSAPSMAGAIRVNPWHVDAVARAMLAAVTVPAEDRLERHSRNYRYLAAHDVGTWARGFDESLRLACGGNAAMRHVGLGLGMSYRAAAVEPGFKALTPESVRPAYRAAARRLILLDYDGTMVPELPDERKREPSEEVLRLLDELCADPKNADFIVSGRGKDQLAAWFAPCEKLGISAELGHFTRWSRDDPWEAAKLGFGSGWKATAEVMMRHYTEITAGSYIEDKETSMAWHYRNADPAVGPCQAKDLHDHLVDALAREPAFVTHGSQIVEVHPTGASKGAAVEGLVAAMARRGEAPDFVLCVGDDRSDEAMFESLAPPPAARHEAASSTRAPPPPLPASANVFTCTVGKKPSKAAAYVRGPAEVLALLRGMAGCSARAPPPVPAAGDPPMMGRRPSMFEIVCLKGPADDDASSGW